MEIDEWVEAPREEYEKAADMIAEPLEKAMRLYVKLGFMPCHEVAELLENLAIDSYSRGMIHGQKFFAKYIEE